MDSPLLHGVVQMLHGCSDKVFFTSLDFSLVPQDSFGRLPLDCTRCSAFSIYLPCKISTRTVVIPQSSAAILRSVVEQAERFLSTHPHVWQRNVLDWMKLCLPAHVRVIMIGQCLWFPWLVAPKDTTYSVDTPMS